MCHFAAERTFFINFAFIRRLRNAGSGLTATKSFFGFMKLIENLTSRFFTRRALPYWSVLFMDVMFTVLAVMAAYALNHGIVNMLSKIYALTGTLLVYSLCYMLGFRMFHVYAGVLRYSSFVDLRRVGFAMTVGLCLAVIFCSVTSGSTALVPLDVADLALGTLIAIVLMWVVRIWVKTLYDGSFKRHRTMPAFIYGVQNGGIALAKNITTSDTSPYALSGFISDESDMQHKRLLGHPVYPADETTARIMGVKGIGALLVSPYKSDALRDNPPLINALLSAGVKILMFPDACEWNEWNGLSYSQLREVDVEDLLPRDKIEVDMVAIGEQLRGKRILITGAAGSIGSEMVRQVAVYSPAELLLVDQAETPLHDIRLMMAREWPQIDAHTVVADIAHERCMENLFAAHRPEYVFHAAAYKHVPMMEDNPAESVTNNIEGTRVVADLALKYGADKFVMVSTDKAVNPTNVMGCSKRICEIYVQSLDKAVKDGTVAGHTRYVTTRFGNVLGSNGSVIPLFQRQIKAGGPVTVTHPDIIRFFMLIPEACKLVLEAGTMGHGGEIFVFDMGAPVRIADLARRMISMSGAKDVEIHYTGLRDGEKLYEEVLNEKEVTIPTFHPKIKIARVREYNYFDARDRVCALVRDAATADDMSVVRAMKAIVPEFRSQHSRYEVLDVPASGL